MAFKDNISAVFADTPGAVKRLGEGLFVKVPLYKAKRRHKPIYINRELFKKLFSCKADPTWAQMSSALEHFFSSTIEKENSTGREIGFAYVDRQTDPLGLSLAGNLGSGRAYYVGGVFNIKGERTPLATSKQKRFSDGLLEMERCIWEAVVGNALQGSITTGLNSVLAILDMDEMCSVAWREEPVKRGKVIRVDLGGELDRITHLFHCKRTLKEREWHDCARAYGRLEGDKFIERIIHGTWSPGNISLQGHLIDFDTVAAVKGRSPQFSATRWHHENYFGAEYHGQIRVLKAMTDDPRINKSHASFKKLKGLMLSAMREQIARRFVELMGFKGKNIYTRYKTEIEDLVELWVELARKGYDRHEALFLKNPRTAVAHAFDTAAFFRVYPMLKRLGLFVPEEAVGLMGNQAIWEAPHKNETGLSRKARQHLKQVRAVIGEHFITEDETYRLLKLATLGFVKKYDRLHKKILRATKEDLKEVEARAYVINEDRAYMFPAYTITYHIAKNKAGRSRAVLNRVIEALVLSNKRVPDKPPYICNVRLYKEGCLCTRLDGKGGHSLVFSFFSHNVRVVNQIKAGERGIELLGSRNKGEWHSKKASNLKICKIKPEEILHTEKIKLGYGERTHTLKNILDD